jgi:hypothetical protein
MEVVNSGAMFSHPLELVADWMRHLNRGVRMNAVGSSDSHTVATTLVGQARTYVRTGDGRPTPASVAGAFSRGETAVSYGLAAFLEQGQGGLTASVYGPSWSRAKRIVVFANGEPIADQAIKGGARGGLQWEGEIDPPAFAHDAWLAVVAVGDDPSLPFWTTNRPYQPATPEWTPMTIGVSPALPWDGNGDGRFETAEDLAKSLLRDAREPKAIATALTKHDLAVASQAAFLLAREGRLNGFLETTGPDLAPQVRERLAAVAAQYAAAQR